MFPAWNRCVGRALGNRASVPWPSQHQLTVQYCPGDVVAYTVMKQLLLLMFIAFASEAMAQDAQCVRERAAMVDTIRAYARSESDVLGPQGISECVLEAMGKTERHRFVS